MRSSANEQSTEVGCVTEQETSPGISKSPARPEDEEEEEEEDEEEDVDFNPFLKGTPSPEASSSLSSEIVGDCEHDEEEITTQATVSPNGACHEGKRCHKDFARKNKKRKSLLICQPEEKTIQEKENGSTSSGIDVNDCMVGDLSNAIHSRKPILDLDDEDAICRRTRARYSLASFTLDELEAFLQETDDDDDLQNVDDEEEYRKFLAAVLQGGDGDDQSTQENENVDDEDEDNDADFEIELEEMLESDYDEGTADKTQKEEFVRAIRRPETRQNRRQKASAQYKKKLLEQSKRPLRPLLPVLPNVPQIAPFSIFDGETLMPETSPSCPSLTTQDALINGFSPHQIGQLYCLIHEHVQLLIQVFSLCILDTSRQNIAHQVQGLIFEMLHKRDETRAFRNEPYPEIYFHPPYICSSVPDAHPQFGLDQATFGSSSSFDAPGVSSPPDIEMSAFQNISTSEGSCGHVSNCQAGSVSVKGSSWVPSVSGLVLSVLDVAPLNLVGKYVDDVYTGKSCRSC